jgi:glycosyltransferase involved in cell wall biosynthesis
MKNNLTKLSVCLITYNHVNFIRQAIDGVLMQKVDFEWELIIADDYSTDGTREILIEYQIKYPELIKLILQDKNVGAAQNWIDLMSAPTSEYIAYLEGDDYWIDQFKVQKQVDILDSNISISISFSQANVLIDETQLFEKIEMNYKPIFNIYDYFASPQPTPSSTWLFRNGLIDFRDKKNLKLFEECIVGDYPLRLLLGDTGDFSFISEVTTVYRKHHRGSTSSFDSLKHLFGVLRMNKALNIFFKDKYDFILMQYPQNIYEKIFYIYCKNKNIFKIITYYFKAIKRNNSELLDFKNRINILKHGIKLFISKN